MKSSLMTALAVLALGGAALLAPAPAAHAQLYAADGGRTAGNLYLINPATGAATLLGTVEDSAGEGYTVGGMAFNAEGTLYAITTSAWTQSSTQTELLTINPATGEATLVASTGSNPKIGDIVFIGATLYAFPTAGDCVHDLATINTTTAALVCADDSGLSDVVGGGLAYDATGEALYVSTDGVDGGLRTIDPSDGSVDATLSLDGVGGKYSGGQPIAALTYYNGTLYGIRKAYGDDAVHLVTINATTGAVQIVGILPPGVDALAGR